MVTRSAMAKANKMAQQQQQRDSDSDDEAPEVVTKASAQEQALDQLRHEHAAKAQAAASAKRKRKARAEATEPTEDLAAEEETDEAAELPADVLSAIATRDEEDRAEQELDEAREQLRRKRPAAAKKRTHIRDFGTVQVATLNALDAAQNRQLAASAEAFLARKAAPQRARMNVLEGHASQFTKKHKQK